MVRMVTLVLAALCCCRWIAAAKANPLALTHSLQTPLDRAKEQPAPSPEVLALLEAAMKP